VEGGAMIDSINLAIANVLLAIIAWGIWEIARKP
jgi:hypothetical protein